MIVNHNPITHYLVSQRAAGQSVRLVHPAAPWALESRRPRRRGPAARTAIGSARPIAPAAGSPRRASGRIPVPAS
jgi:hypothetical protein